MGVVEIGNGCLVDGLLPFPLFPSLPLPFSLFPSLLLPLSGPHQFEAIELWAVEYPPLFRVAYVISQHHQQLVLLKLLIGELAHTAAIPFKSPGGVCVEPGKVVVHALGI